MELGRRLALLIAVAAAATGGPALAQTAAGPSAGGGFEPAMLAPAPKRLAIVIGNADYRHASPLKNALADADLVADYLGDNGYRVLRFENLDKRAFEAMLQDALYEIDRDSELVFYYAGHGIQVAGSNYILPVDAQLTSPYDLHLEAVSLANVVDMLGGRARTQMFILDSCRENPFDGELVLATFTEALSETQEGFSFLTAPINSLLSFSSSPGQRAWDGSGENSPFTAALVDTARTHPELPVAQVLERVRRQVFEVTAGRQVPWESSTMVQPVAFGAASAPTRLSPGEVPEDGIVFRSWLHPTLPEPASVTTEPATDDTAPRLVALKLPLEKEVRIGAGIPDLADLPPDTPVTLVDAPRHGRLVIPRADGMREDADPLKPLTAGQLRSAILDVDLPRQTAQADAPIEDEMSVDIEGRTVRMSIDIEANDCDREAGDHLDPDGVRFAVYPNEMDPPAALAACMEAVRAQPDVGRFHYQLGRAYVALQQLDEARASFETARDLGHTRAWHGLGELVALGEAATAGVDGQMAPQEALDLYERGVELSDPYAFHSLGLELLRHGETDAEKQRGFELLNRAVELGHTFSMNALGGYYIDADNPNADPDRAVRYWQESAARDDIYGFNNMGYAYENGLGGLEQDAAAAADHYQRAIDGQHPTAPRQLGNMWAEGELEGGDPNARALQYYDIGIDRADAWAGANGAWVILQRGVDGVTPADAAVRAAKAAALSDAAAVSRARELLATVPVGAVNAAAQTVINETIAEMAQRRPELTPRPDPIIVDGAFGPGSDAAMRAVVELLEVESPPAEPRERLVGIARAYWKARGVRIDLL